MNEKRKLLIKIIFVAVGHFQSGQNFMTQNELVKMAEIQSFETFPKRSFCNVRAPVCTNS